MKMISSILFFETINQTVGMHAEKKKGNYWVIFPQEVAGWLARNYSKK